MALMDTYNIYQCACGYIFDCDHSVTVSLKVVCPDCGELLKHTQQVDQFTLKEMLS